MPETWAAVLNEMEKRAARGEPTPWVPPVGLGPIPEDLRQRAREVMSALSQAITSTKAEIHAADARKRMVRAVPAAVTVDSPRYLDEAF